MVELAQRIPDEELAARKMVEAEVLVVRRLVEAEQRRVRRLVEVEELRVRRLVEAEQLRVRRSAGKAEMDTSSAAELKAEQMPSASVEYSLATSLLASWRTGTTGVPLTTGFRS